MTDFPRRRWQIPLQALFGLIFAIVLLLPLSGMYFFRIYQTELVRQTERELIAQGVFISTFYKDALHELKAPKGLGVPVTVSPVPDDGYQPYPPQLDLREDAVLPPRPDAVRPAAPPAALSTAAAKRLQPLLDEAKLSTLSSVRLLDAAGTVISTPLDSGLSLAGASEVAAALQGRYGSAVRQRGEDEGRETLDFVRGTEIRVFVAMPVIDDGRLVGAVYLSRSPRNVLKALYEERGSAMAAGLCALLAASLIAAFLGYMIGRPLAALKRNAERLARGEESPQAIAPTPVAEIASLIESFEAMARAIELRSSYIRDFTMHLAHEFKTPLAAIQGAAELLRDHPEDMALPQRQRFADNIMQDTARMKRLVSRLLELARADMRQAAPKPETPAKSPVAAIAAALRARYAAQLQIEIAGDASVPLEPELLEDVFVNLIENSLQHGAAHLRLAAAAQGPIVTIDITDDGRGISPGNAGKIFTPFFTTKRESGGTGLGLTICRALLRAAGGDIAHVPSDTGAHFRITLSA